MRRAPAIVPAPTGEDRDRMAEQAFRRRVLTGRWAEDLRHTITKAVGTKRADAWRLPDTSSNPARQYCHAVSELYSRTPAVSHPRDAVSGALMQQVLEGAAWVSRMQALQPLTVGVREGILRLDLVGESIVLREVDPSLVIASARSVDRGQPRKVCEYRQRIDPRDRGRVSWVREIWDAKAGTVTLLDENGEDVTLLHYGSSEYPYTYTAASGEVVPIMPYVFYHAADTGRLFDPFEMGEIFTGTLMGGVYWSFFSHRLRSASWPQRYMAGLQPAGIEPSTNTLDGYGEGRRDIVVADPAVVLALEPVEDLTGQPMIGAFPDGSPLSEYVEAVTTYDRHTISTAGLDASEIQRMDGDPRSGYAISLSAHGKREAKRRYESSFAKSDAILCATAARMLRGGVESGRITVLADRYADLATGGYSVAYTSLGMTPDEKRALADEVTKMIAAGVLTVDEARRKLAAAGYFDDIGGLAPIAKTEQSRNSYQISNLVQSGVLSADEARNLLAAAGYFDVDQTKEAPELVLPVSDDGEGSP